MSGDRSLGQQLSAKIDDVRSAVHRAAFRGRDHFERVEATPHRVTVTGVRGKSTVVRWLNEALVEAELQET